MSQSSGLPETIDPDQVTRSLVVYRLRDQQALVIDSVILPPPLLHRFVRAWNTSEESELRKFLSPFTIKLQFRDGTNRAFRFGWNYAKEKNDWSFRMKDTTISASLDSLRQLNERWNGTYSIDNSVQLVLHGIGSYEYSFNQCTQGEHSNGTWAAMGDTLRLYATPDTSSTATTISQYAYFKEPFVLRGRQLYFTIEGALNYNHFFTKE